MGRFRIAEVELAKKAPVHKLRPRRELGMLAMPYAEEIDRRLGRDDGHRAHVGEFPRLEGNLAYASLDPPPLNVSPELGTREPLLLPVM